MIPFDYPPVPLVRRHGPRGYQDVESFREWLRDEFSFRCVFCLRRERWDPPTALHIDHYLPLAKHGAVRLRYENLLYVCSSCNLFKSDEIVPDPSQHLHASSVRVEKDGTVVASTAEARAIIMRLGLNRPESVQFRLMWIGFLELATHFDSKLFQSLLGFPDDLPNLQALKPPAGNDRPDGIASSYFAQRARGELPAIY